MHVLTLIYWLFLGWNNFCFIALKLVVRYVCDGMSSKYFHEKWVKTFHWIDNLDLSQLVLSGTKVEIKTKQLKFTVPQSSMKEITETKINFITALYLKLRWIGICVEFMFQLAWSHVVFLPSTVTFGDH